MTTVSEEIKKRIYDVLSDGKVHYTEEIRKRCLDDGILSQDDVGKIRVVVYYLKKKDTRIISVGRGKYKMNLEANEQKVWEFDVDAEKNSELEQAIEIIKNNMEKWKSINWLICSEDELCKIREDYKKLTILSKEITNFEKSEKW